MLGSLSPQTLESHAPVVGSHLQASFRNAPRSSPPPYTYTKVPLDVPPALYLSAGPVVPVVHGPGIPPPGRQVGEALGIPVGVLVGVEVAVNVGVADGVPHDPSV